MHRAPTLPFCLLFGLQLFYKIFCFSLLFFLISFACFLIHYLNIYLLFSFIFFLSRKSNLYDSFYLYNLNMLCGFDELNPYPYIKVLKNYLLTFFISSNNFSTAGFTVILFPNIVRLDMLFP